MAMTEPHAAALAPGMESTGRRRRSPTSPRPARCAPTSSSAFRRNKLAMVGLVFIVLLVLVAVFAPLIAPYSYSERTPALPRSRRRGTTVRHRHDRPRRVLPGRLRRPGVAEDRHPGDGDRR